MGDEIELIKLSENLLIGGIELIYTKSGNYQVS